LDVTTWFNGSISHHREEMNILWLSSEMLFQGCISMSWTKYCDSVLGIGKEKLGKPDSDLSLI